MYEISCCIIGYGPVNVNHQCKDACDGIFIGWDFMHRKVMQRGTGSLLLTSGQLSFGYFKVFSHKVVEGLISSHIFSSESKNSPPESPFQTNNALTIPLPLFILLSCLIYRIHLAYFSRLSKIPSAHPSVPFSSFWLLLQKYKARENHARHTAHEKLGPIVRIGPKEVSVSCVENGVRTIYSGKFDKPMWYMNAFWGDE
ncbi:hypothetical protein EAF04_004876 [Stromatinia cepivora]|nr:hypothetical protein EAF04_004876 [Stromatinia cepivora]